MSKKVEISMGSSYETNSIAKEFAEGEFEKYRVIQDRLFMSDFDRLIDSIGNDQE